jgi:hypothetical protein
MERQPDQKPVHAWSIQFHPLFGTLSGHRQREPLILWRPRGVLLPWRLEGRDPAREKRDLNPKTRTPSVPVDKIGCCGWQRVDCAFGEFDAWHGLTCSVGATYLPNR